MGLSTPVAVFAHTCQNQYPTALSATSSIIPSTEFPQNKHKITNLISNTSDASTAPSPTKILWKRRCQETGMMRARALTIEGSFPAIAITAAPEAIFVFPTIPSDSELIVALSDNESLQKWYESVLMVSKGCLDNIDSVSCQHFTVPSRPWLKILLEASAALIPITPAAGV
jgi:hypothetical protein